MENRNSEPAAAGIDAAATGFSAAVRNLQVFAEEIGRVSRSSFEQNAKLIDDLSTAREVGDIVAIQTKFMTGMIATFNEHVRVMMSRMANIPLSAGPFAESFTEPCAELAKTAEKPADAAAAMTAEPQPNSAAGVASDAQAAFATEADLAPAEPEAMQTTGPVEQAVPAASNAGPKPNGDATAPPDVPDVHAGSDMKVDLPQIEPQAIEVTETIAQAAAVTSEAGPKPNGGAASDAHTDFASGADLAQAEPEAFRSMPAAEPAPAPAPEPVAAADTTPQDMPATATAYAPFIAAPGAGEELVEAGVGAAQEAEQSATETTQWAAKANREAWQELAKAAADLLRAEPLPAEPQHDAEIPDAPQSSEAGDHPV